MSKGVKVLLLVLGLCFVGMIIVVAGAGAWVYSNKDDLKEGVVRIQAEAERFGQATDQAGCMAEAERKLRAECGPFGPVCEGKVAMFQRGCLEAARPTPGFCDGVPSNAEIVDSTTWALEQCGVGDAVSGSRCQRLMQGKQSFCSSPNR